MKFTLKELIDMVLPLSNLNKQPLPIKTAHKLLKLTNRIDPELKEFDNLRIKLVEKYGDRKEDGSLFVNENDKDKYEGFIDELGQLFLIETDIEFEPIDLTELNVNISPNDFSQLIKLFKE